LVRAKKVKKILRKLKIQVSPKKKKEVHTGCPRVAKKLHNLFVFRDISLYIFVADQRIWVNVIIWILKKKSPISAPSRWDYHNFALAGFRI
jgi:hypothetical protein